MKVNIIYFVDTETNIKETICVVPCDKDMRDEKIINAIAEKIREMFTHDTMVTHFSDEIAHAISYIGYSSIDVSKSDYEFGVEREISLIE